MRTNKIVFRIVCVALVALVPEALDAASVNSRGKSAKTDGDYMIINLTPNAKGKFPVTFTDMSVTKANATFNTDEYKSGKIVLRKVAAGSSYYYRPHCTKQQSEKPLAETDKIPVTRDFWIGLFEVTEAQYARAFGRTCADITPVSPVAGQAFSENDESCGIASCPCFMKRLSTNCVDVTGKPVGGFDLPTEAQWEIACRAGTATKFSCGDSLSADYAIYNEQYNRPQRVGMKKPNAWGIYDMHGNVAEWCRDRSCGLYDNSCRAKTAEGFCALHEARGCQQIYRGGCWESNAYGCASSTREEYDALDNNIGFRLSRTAPALSKKASGKNKKALGKK